MVGSIRGVNLMDGEEILHNQTPKWRDYPFSLMLGTVGLLAAGAGVLVFIWIWFRKRSKRLVVTNERVIQIKTSRTNTSTTEYPIRDINQIETSGERRSWIGSKRGTISFSVGGGGEQVQLKNLREYDEIATTIREQQRRIAQA